MVVAVCAASAVLVSALASPSANAADAMPVERPASTTASAPAVEGRAVSAPDRPVRGAWAAEADGEVASLRTETSRTYRLPNGTMRAKLFDRPVNFRDSAGRWQRNDTSLVPDAADARRLRNAAGAFRLSLPRDLSSGPVEITSGGHTVGFALRGGQGAPVVDGSVATYPQALPGVGLEYAVSDTGVKETLILAGASAPTSFVFDVNLSRQLELRESADGGLVAVAGGREALRFAPPSVQDAAPGGDGFSESATRFALSGTATAPVVTLTLDRAWLTDPARVFPVRLDPSFGVWLLRQTHINSTATTTNYVNYQWLNVGKAADGSRHNGLIQFDTSPVPKDVTVLDATLEIELSSWYSASDGNTIEARPLTRSWSSSNATWIKADATTNWTTPGGDVGSVVASDVFNLGETWMFFKIRDLAKGWVNGTTPNYGVQLTGTSTSSSTNVSFTKSSPDPAVFIDYIVPTGDRPWWSYTTRDLDDRRSAKVNVASGNLLLLENDLKIAAPGITPTVTRAYNSRDTSSISNALPPGWTQTPGNDERLQQTPLGRLHRGTTGTSTLWTVNGSVYPSAAGSGQDLATSTGSGGTLTSRSSGLVRTFNSDGRLTSLKDRNGNTQTYTHNSTTGQVTSLTDTAGRSTSMTYGNNSVGYRLTTVTDASSRTWSYGYGNSGGAYLYNYTDPEGQTVYYGYDSAGLLSEIVFAGDHKTMITYDSKARVTTLKQVTNTSNNTGPTTSFTYTDTSGGGGTTTITDPRGKVSVHTWDVSGRVTQVVDPLNRTRSGTYNADNAVTTAVDAMSPAGTTTHSYDSDFRPTTTAAPGGATSTLRYAETAGTLPVTRPGHWQPSGAIDADGSDTSLSYDGVGNLTTASTTNTGGAVAQTYTYNPPAPASPTCGGKPGQVCTATDGRSKTTSYSYDSAGNLTTITPPSPLPASTATYDSIGRRLSSTDGKGQTTRYVYDGRDRVREVKYGGTTTCTTTDKANGSCIGYFYDASGLMSSTTDSTGTTTFAADPLGRQTGKTLPGQSAQTLAYDLSGNVTSATDPVGTTTYTYDDANQLTKLAEPGGSCTSNPTVKCTTFAYNNNGVRTTTTYPTTTATVVTVTPDSANRTQRILAVTGATTHVDLNYDYVHAASSNPNDDTALVRRRIDNSPAGAGKTFTYDYDGLNRLTNATEKTSGGTTLATFLYGYDAAGNRTSDTDANGTSYTSVYNDANQITSRGGVSGYAHDSNGNQTAAPAIGTRPARTAAYNSKDQTSSFTVAGTTANQTYIGHGQNERTANGTTTYASSATGLVTQTTSGTTTSYIREPGGNLLAIRVAGSSYYYLKDNLASIVGLVNSSGSRVNTYAYDPYGKPLSVSETVANPYRYTSGYLDSTSGLYKLGIRYYDPSLGRFTQTDPTGQDSHYAYARNSPCSFVDPSGSVSVSDFTPYLKACGTGAAVSLGVTLLGTVISGGTLTIPAALTSIALGCGEDVVIQAIGDVFGPSARETAEMLGYNLNALELARAWVRRVL